MANALSGSHVLVVEDDADARELLTILLTRSGATVDSASSVADAWLLLTTHPTRIDLVISDIGMPDEDGYVLIERLRNTAPPLGSTPAIALTAFDRGEDRARAHRSGFDAHTPKPVKPDELVALAARVLAQTPSRPPPPDGSH